MSENKKFHQIENKKPCIEEQVSTYNTFESITLGKFIHDKIFPKNGDRTYKTANSKWLDEKYEKFSKESVAKRLDISESMLQKKLYHKDTSREWIIAICVAYGLDEYETSDALVKYNWASMDNDALREDLICKYLRAHRRKPSSLKMINGYLESAGMRALQIQKRKKKSDSETNAKIRFKPITDILLRTYGFEDTKRNSLKTEYYPTHTVTASMIVEDSEKNSFELWATSGGCLLYYELIVDEDGNHNHLNSTVHDWDKNATNYPDFENFYTILTGKIQNAMQKYDDLLNDSKNYQGRFSANLKESALHAFYEIYNYDCPERNEYYLMEYWKGKYSLSVSKKSMFMQEYLSEEEYYAHYHSHDKISRKTYFSTAEIDAMLTKDDYQKNKSLNNVKKAFLRLEELLKSKISDIQNRKIFIRNSDSLWIPYEVLSFYDIEDIFMCQYDEEFGEIKSCEEKVTIDSGTENEVVVTFEDVYAGYECGFDSFAEICEFKRQHKSITDVLK